MKDKKQKWKAELERDYSKYSRNDELRKGGLKLSAKDFPKFIDGILFQNIEEYVLFFGGSTPSNFDLEMESVDRPYDELFDYLPQSVRNIGQYFRHSTSHSTIGFSKEPSKPRIKLAKQAWKRIDEIAHMRYCVVRAADGLYYAVWVGLMPAGKLVLVMAEVVKAELPISVPQQFAGCNVHTSKGFTTFNRAESEFGGYESLWRTKDRIKKAKDPDYIPPNLRKLAVEATFVPEIWNNNIDASEHKRLQRWLDDGCKSWYGKDPNTDWYKQRNIHLPYRFTSVYRAEQELKAKQEQKKGKQEQLLLPGTTEGANGYIAEVWDGNLKRKVKKWFRN